MIDMGRLQTTVIVACFGEEMSDEEAGGIGEPADDQTAGVTGSDTPAAKSSKGSTTVKSINGKDKCPYTVLAVRSDEDLGALNFDHRMFQHFAGVVSECFCFLTTLRCVFFAAALVFCLSRYCGYCYCCFFFVVLGIVLVVLLLLGIGVGIGVDFVQIWRVPFQGRGRRGWTSTLVLL